MDFQKNNMRSRFENLTILLNRAIFSDSATEIFFFFKTFQRTLLLGKTLLAIEVGENVLVGVVKNPLTHK
jgi:hypothetical protein